MVIYKCDAKDCNTWAEEPSLFTVVYHTTGQVKIYCTLWCLVVEESRDAEPPEVVNASDH